jgi:3,4-dihydroxy-2-butanone 4-phosphate synthase
MPDGVNKSAFATVPEAVAEIRAGRMVVVVDDEDRENEGDLTLAAEFVTPEAINFMARFGRGLICLTLTEERADYLRLAPMTSLSRSRPARASPPESPPPTVRTPSASSSIPAPPRTTWPAQATSFPCARAREEY